MRVRIRHVFGTLLLALAACTAKAPATVTSTSPHEETTNVDAKPDSMKLLVGRWQPVENPILTLEFDANGGFASWVEPSPPSRGTYKWIDKNTIEITQGNSQRLVVVIEGDILSMGKAGGTLDKLRRLK